MFSTYPEVMYFPKVCVPYPASTKTNLTTCSNTRFLLMARLVFYFNVISIEELHCLE